MSQDRWLLPEGIEESLPEEAAWLESHRRDLIDMFSTWGYELVMPPLIEYLDSLLIGPSEDLDLQTFKLTDQLTGKLMGVRADMTPQVARIDAHRFKRDAPTRFCYIGTVLHTRPSGRALTRSPLQLGAELYGHAGIDSDVEVICLMLKVLDSMGSHRVLLDLGHVGVLASLMEQAGFTEMQQKHMQTLLQQKALSEYEQFLATCSVDKKWQAIFLSLMDLNGGDEVIAQTRAALSGCGEQVIEHVDYIQQIATQVMPHNPDIQLHYDFATSNGYRYQNGAVFAAYVAEQGSEIARGGRYDMIGRVFGRSRPATGFSMDLKALAKISPQPRNKVSGIYAPHDEDAALIEKISQLRRQGERVICALSNQSFSAAEMQCDRVLVKQNQHWTVKEA